MLKDGFIALCIVAFIFLLIMFLPTGCSDESKAEEPPTMCQEYCRKEGQCDSFIPGVKSWHSSKCHQCRALCRIEAHLVLLGMQEGL